MITILWQEIWHRKWFIIWWSAGLAVLMALVIAVYPSFRDQAATLNQSLEQLPDALKSLAADTNDFLSPVGYMSSNGYYVMLPILFGILAIGLGSSLLARDEQNHTLELLLSRPVSRTRLLLGKALAGIIIVAIVTASTTLGTVLLAWMVNLGIPLIHLVYATMMSALLALIFGALSFTLTAIGHSARLASIGISTLLLVCSYLFTSLAGTVHWLQWPAKVLPYNFYHPSDIMTNGLTSKDAIGMAVVIVVLGIISIVVFRRRDID